MAPTAPKFTHLHVHSHYSLLDGLGQVDSLLETTKTLGMESIALTDHGVLYGAVEWYKQAKKFGVKPIIGVEGYIAPNKLDQKRGKADQKPYHVTLLAKDRTGYRNLIKLTNIAHLQGYYYKPRMDYEVLAKYSEGLICLSGCVNGNIPREILSGNIDRAAELTEQYIKMFGRENFFLEMQHHPGFDKQEQVNERILELSKQFSVPIVATSDAHFIRKEDEGAHDILLCVQTGKKVSDKGRMSYQGLGTYLKTPAEMAEDFKDLPQALESTQQIAERCVFDLELGKVHLPKFPLPAEKTPDQQLRELCERGYEERFGVPYAQAPAAHRERLDYELGVITKTGFSNYTLIVHDYVTWAKAQGIVVGPGRGSAAGSLVSYLIKITDIDPLRWGLFFERYMNPARVSFPDIDTDFDDARRDEVIEYVSQKYGRDRVAQIITFGTIKARNAIRDAGRVLDVPYAVCDRLAKMIPMKLNLKQALEQVAELKAVYSSDPQAKQLIDAARKLEGVARNAGTHACGVVISDVPLDEIVPCQFATRGTETTQNITTQFDAHGCEDVGLIKMDFLGLSNLTIIQHTLGLIEKRYGKDRRIDIGKLPLDDAKTFALLQEARTVGVFQLESSGMRRYLKEMKPTELEDIVAMVALYRPGPMEQIPKYIERKHSGHVPPLLHPKLEPILKTTYGIAVYQEQVMEIAQQLAGFTLGEGYLLVKAVAKKIKKLLDEQRGKFIDGCEKTGVGRKIGEQLFAFIEPFAQYGFNRSHAACYAMIAFQTAYLKAHYPAEFMAALLRSDEDDTDRMSIEIGECQKMGIHVLPPSVNQSFKHFTVVNLGTDGKPLADGRSLHEHIEGVEAGVRFGLAGIKNLGSDAVEQIIAERDARGPFTSLADLVTRIDPQSLNKKSLEALAQSGALDEFGERAAILATIPTLTAVAKKHAEAKASKQQGLFGAAVQQATPAVTLAEVEAAPRMQRLAWEKELLGLYVSEQPLSEHRDLIEAKCTPAGSLKQEHVNRNVRCVGLVSHIQKITTRSGEPMLFVQLDDFSGNVEALIFPSVLKEHSEIITEEAVLVVTGKVSDKDGQIKLLANAVAVFAPDTLANAAPVDSGGGGSGFSRSNFSRGSAPARTTPEPTYNDQPVPDAPMASASVAAPAVPPSPAALPPAPAGSLELMLEQAFSVDKLRELKSCLQGLPTGDAAVLLRVREGARERRIKTNYKVALNPAIRARLEEIVGPGKVSG